MIKIFIILFSLSFSIDYGIDIFIRDSLHLIKGKKIAILANNSSVNNKGINIVDILNDNKNIDLVRIFSPEHGFKSDYSAGEKINNDNYKNVDIISLYGKRKKPSKNYLFDLDFIVIDIQDIGSSYYTYVSTVTYMLEVAAENDISIIILDRPNPIGRDVYGPIKDYNYFSFIGMHPVPVRHGMTIGELCLMINEEGWLKKDLKVKDMKIIKMETIPSQIEFDNWIPPSPNIPDIETAFIYNGTCLFEGTNISEGRGTAHPFKWIGAPWIKSNELADYIKTLNYGSKVKVKQIEFIPKSSRAAKKPKYEGQVCYGISIDLDDSIQPIKFTLKLLEYFYKEYEEFQFIHGTFFDTLYGNSYFRECLKNDCDLQTIFNGINKDIINFNRSREKYLFY